MENEHGELIERLAAGLEALAARRGTEKASARASGQRNSVQDLVIALRKPITKALAAGCSKREIADYLIDNGVNAKKSTLKKYLEAKRAPGVRARKVVRNEPAAAGVPEISDANQNSADVDLEAEMAKARAALGGVLR